MSARLGDFEIPDDSGIIAVVDPFRYKPYIGEDWTLEALLDRFRDSMADRCLLVWSPGSEGNWRVTASLGPAPEYTSFRSAAGTIDVSDAGLYVVSYDSLTMAAQYADEPIPQPHERGNLITLSPGTYTCEVLQLFPAEHAYRPEAEHSATPHFVLSFAPSAASLPPWRSVQWLEL